MFIAFNRSLSFLFRLYPSSPIVSTSKTNMKLFLIAAVLIASVCAEPESEAKADAKPCWLTPTTDMLDIHMLLDMLPTHTLVYTELDTTVTLLDTTTWERDPLTPNLTPSHG